MKYYKVPLPSFKSGVSFDYRGDTYRMTTPRYTELEGVGRYTVDLAWSDRRILGIDIIEGTNLVKQYGRCPIQGMYVHKKVASPLTPKGLGDLYEMYIVEG